jgi:hypothetical protein
MREVEMEEHIGTKTRFVIQRRYANRQEWRDGTGLCYEDEGGDMPSVFRDMEKAMKILEECRQYNKRFNKGYSYRLVKQVTEFTEVA